MESKENKITITVLDPSGSSEKKVTVGPDAKISNIIKQVVSNFKLPNDQSYDAILKRTNTNLTPDMTIGKSGIKDGDVIRLRTTQEGGFCGSKTSKTSKRISRFS